MAYLPCARHSGKVLSTLPGLYQSFLQPSEVTGTCWLVGCATAPLVPPALPHFRLRKEGSLPVTSNPNFKQPTQTFRSRECLEPALALRNRCANFPANTLRTKCSARFGSTYTKVGTIQRRLAWPLRKDDTQIREAKKKKKKKKKNKMHLLCIFDSSKLYF